MVEVKKGKPINLHEKINDFMPIKKENAKLSKEIANLVKERQYELARVALLDYIKTYPTTEWARHQLSLIYYQMGRTQEALELLNALTELDPDNVDYMMALGSLSYDNEEKKDSEKSIHYLRKTLEKRPNDYHAWRNLGVTLYNHIQSDDKSEAFDCLFKSAHLFPNDFVTHNALCMYLETSKRNQEARAHGAMSLILKDQHAEEVFKMWKDRLNLHLKDNGKIELQDRSKRTKNILSFSLWGDDPSYVEGAIANVRGYKDFLPHWTCRFYHDETVPKNKIFMLNEMNAETILVDEETKKLAGGMWRFMVANDDEVDYFCCRDSDCRPTEREIKMIEDWQKSSKIFHIIRDDIWHCDLMLAGLWGGRAGFLPDMLKMGQATYDNSVRKWDDQEFLRDYIWPMIKKHSKIHDNNYRILYAEAPPILRPMGEKSHVGHGHRLGKQKSHVRSVSLNTSKQDTSIAIKNLIAEQFQEKPNTTEVKIILGDQAITATRDIASKKIYVTYEDIKHDET